MKARRLPVDGVFEITPEPIGDSRGYFVENFRQDWFREHVADALFVQENQSMSRRAGTVRGLHLQVSPFVQGKLVRCLQGALFDVAVDVRRGSRDFGKWVGATLTAEAGNQLWVPPGFLHGFCTLTDDCVINYKVTSYYSRECERGVAWDDADIGIAWPQAASAALMSDRDRSLPPLRAAAASFEF